MEQSTDVVARAARARRLDARAQAFAGRAIAPLAEPEPQPGPPAGEHYVTPAWLDRSFVLPVSGPREEDRGPDNRPGTGTGTGTLLAEAPRFERPPSPQVDFAAMVRRADACRRGHRTALLAFLVALLAVVSSVVASSSVAAPLAVAATIVGVASALWAQGLTRAPVVVREA
jgi:hypothetical protein